MTLRILAAAKADLEDGFDFYERQEPGLGTAFVIALNSDIDSLSTYAGIHARYYGGYHRLLSKRFPYAIYYLVSGKRVVVIYAVLDCRRDPAWIRKRLA